MFWRKSAPKVAAADFPEIVNYATTSRITNRASAALNLPSSRTAGNLLLVIASVDGATINYTISEGWTIVFQVSSGLNNFLIATRTATNDESDACTITFNGASECYEIAMYQISGANTSTPIDYATATGDSDAPNPPSLTDDLGIDSYLWISCFGADNSAEVTINAYGDANYNNVLTLNTSDNDAILGIAFRQLRAATENPGAWSFSVAEQWVAATISVRPA